MIVDEVGDSAPTAHICLVATLPHEHQVRRRDASPAEEVDVPRHRRLRCWIFGPAFLMIATRESTGPAVSRARGLAPRGTGLCDVGTLAPICHCGTGT